MMIATAYGQLDAVVLESRVLLDRASDRADSGLASQELSVVREWHDVTHDGPFEYCTEQPCHAVNYASRRDR